MGAIIFDWSGGGTLDENGRPVWVTNEYTSVPGGLTLPISATISEVSEDGSLRNSDGTQSSVYRTTYTCELPQAQ